MTWRERLEGENTLEEDLFALFEDLKNSGPRGNNNRAKQVRLSRMVQHDMRPLLVREENISNFQCAVDFNTPCG